jgi:Sulfotransferase family
MGTHVGDNIERRYVFICGLHRSGTSVLGRNIGRMENCTGFMDTGVIEDEGQFLQDVYPTAQVYGGAGRFGFDRRAHLTETSSLLTPQNALKLRRSWEQYWDPNKAIKVEKTPGNLLKTRFLQAAFPNSYFIVIRRHPVSVSMANQKWKKDLITIHKLFEHWLHCHALLDEDKKHLQHVYELSYEDYVQDPGKYHAEIAAFIGSRVSEDLMEQVTDAYNQKYFSRWSELLCKSPLKGYYRFVAAKYEGMFTKYGYSLTKGFGVNEEQLRGPDQIGAPAGVLYCSLADVNALMIRLTTRSKGYIKRQLRARLPESLKTRLKDAVQKPAHVKNSPTIPSS